MNYYHFTITITIFTLLSIGLVYAEESNTIDANGVQQNLDKTPITKEKTSASSFNIAVAADWGCNDDAKKTSQNIQEKNPELVIAAGDLSYKRQADCWENIISP